MKVVERYILRRAFGVFAAALFWTLAIVWTTQVLTRIDFITTSGQSALAFFGLGLRKVQGFAGLTVSRGAVAGVDRDG